MTLPMLMAVSCLSPVRTQIFISASASAAMLSGTPWNYSNKQLQKAGEYRCFFPSAGAITGGHIHRRVEKRVAKCAKWFNQLEQSRSTNQRSHADFNQLLSSWSGLRAFPAVTTSNVFPNLPNQQYVTPNGKIKTNLLQLVLDSSGSQQKQIL